MAVLDRIAYFQNRRDEVPNQELARELVRAKNKDGIREIAENLQHKNKSVRSDCLKVLYEIGYIEPELIADYVGNFLELLKSKDNRMVWGAMIGLATIAEKRPKEIWEDLDEVIDTVGRGSLITVVWGIKTLARLASVNKKYSTKIFPFFLTQLKTCNPHDLPMHADSIAGAVNRGNKAEFLAILEARKKELKPSQLARLKKVTKEIET